MAKRYVDRSTCEAEAVAVDCKTAKRHLPTCTAVCCGPLWNHVLAVRMPDHSAPLRVVAAAGGGVSPTQPSATACSAQLKACNNDKAACGMKLVQCGTTAAQQQKACAAAAATAQKQLKTCNANLATAKAQVGAPRSALAALPRSLPRSAAAVPCRSS